MKSMEQIGFFGNLFGIMKKKDSGQLSNLFSVAFICFDAACLLILTIFPSIYLRYKS